MPLLDGTRTDPKPGGLCLQMYLSRGIGLVLVDVVTNRLANLHDELMAELGRGGPFLLTTPT